MSHAAIAIAAAAAAGDDDHFECQCFAENTTRGARRHHIYTVGHKHLAVYF